MSQKFPIYPNSCLCPVLAPAPEVRENKTLSAPAGERELMQGGDEVIGAYESLSLHSPMFAFKSQEAAREEVDRRLRELMRPSDDSDPDENGRLRPPRQEMSRRDFLRGARPES